MEDEQLFQTGDGSILQKAEAAELFGGEQALMELVEDGEVSLYEGDSLPTSQQQESQEEDGMEQVSQGYLKFYSFEFRFKRTCLAMSRCVMRANRSLSLTFERVKKRTE